MTGKKNDKKWVSNGYGVFVTFFCGLLPTSDFRPSSQQEVAIVSRLLVPAFCLLHVLLSSSLRSSSVFRGPWGNRHPLYRFAEARYRSVTQCTARGPGKLERGDTTSCAESTRMTLCVSFELSGTLPSWPSSTSTRRWVATLAHSYVGRH